METWKQCISVPAYEVSDHGNVRLILGGRWNKPGKPRKQWHVRGYCYSSLTVDGKPKGFLIHRLVMEAFCGQSPLQVNHKNGNKADNRLENLEYVTAHANRAHAKAALDAYPKGEAHHNSKLKEIEVRSIFELIDKRWSDREIASVFDCTSANIWMIRNGKAWAHLSMNPRPPNYKGRKPL